MTTLGAAILVLGVLILVHELGHFFAARSVGVRVDRFSIGFPPRLITLTSVDNGWNFKLFFYKRDDSGKLVWGPIKESVLSVEGRVGSGTEYCLALIPFGGYVKMAGTIDESLDPTIKNKPYELMSKSRLAQTWVMSAGILMNIVLAFILFTGIVWNTGLPEASDEPVVHEIVPELPADKAGLKIGDRITAIDDVVITSWTELSGIIHQLPNTEIELAWESEGIIQEKTITTYFQINPAFYFMALISVNLAFINLLPIPGLDGGHIFITLIEGTIRRPLSVKTRMLIQQVGMVFLLLIMATVLFNDFSRLFGN